MSAAAVVDASGDAVIAAAAGAEFVQRPDPQSPTAMFRFGGVDTDTAMRLSRDDLRAALESATADGVSLPRTAGGMFSVRPGVVHVNITRVPVPDNGALLAPVELGRLEREGRTQISMYERVFRRYVPGFADAFVLDSGTDLGIRESRRLVGRYKPPETTSGQARAWTASRVARGRWRATVPANRRPGSGYHLASSTRSRCGHCCLTASTVSWLRVGRYPPIPSHTHRPGSRHQAWQWARQQD